MDIRITNILLATLLIVSCTMLIWTINYIEKSINTDMNSSITISAFNA